MIYLDKPPAIIIPATKELVVPAAMIVAAGQFAVSAFPVVQGTQTSLKTYNTTNTADLPASVAAGERLLLFARYSAGITLTFPGGWTNLYDALDINNVLKGGCWYATAAGGETTVSITASASTAINAIAYRISGHVGNPEATSANGTSNTQPNPPNLAPSWGATPKTLWIVHDAQALNVVQTAPTNYSGLVTGASNQHFTAQRNLQAASEDPGTFSAGSAQGWRAGTVAVRGT